MIIRTCLMYHEACNVEFEPFKRSYSQLTFQKANSPARTFLLYVTTMYEARYSTMIFYTRYDVPGIYLCFIRVFAKVRFSKCTLSKVGFDQKLRYIFVSLFHWPTTHRAFVRGRTPLQRPIVPQTSRTGQPGQAPLCVQQQRKQ